MGEIKVSCEMLFMICQLAGIPDWTIASIDDVEATVVSMIEEVF